jgi:4'-phosphopantetheinyl transferase
VRVFAFDLDQAPAVVERLDATLPAEDRGARVPVRVARAALRVLLARELGVAPADVPISRRCEHCGHPAHGRPALEGRELSFSLSHSRAVGLVALAPAGLRVGVDVEVVRPRPGLDALAARVLGDEEHARWNALDGEAARLDAFLRAWTAKEAYLKALGVGITTRLRDVPARVEGWSTVPVEVGPGCVAALAADCVPLAVQQHAAVSLFQVE